MTALAALWVLLRVGVPIELWSPILSAADSVEDVALLAVTAHEETGGTWDCERVGDLDQRTQSYGCWQCKVHGPERLRVQTDAYYAASLALERIRASLKRCGSLGEYLRGSCEPLKQADRRFARARALWSR